MTNAPQHPAYARQDAAGGAFGWYPPVTTDAGSGGHRLNRSLWIVVAVIGLSTFGVNAWSSAPLGFPVRFGVLAAVVAAVGLLPKQGGRGWVVVALAVTGFFDALAAWISAHEQGWAPTVIMVLNALQALAAVGALLYETKVPASAESSGGTDYSEYTRFVQAYQAYATQYQQAAAAASYTAAGQAQATARAQSSGRPTADVRAAAPDDPLAGLEARYARHAAAGRPPGESAQGSSAPAGHLGPGIPNANHGAPESRPWAGPPQHGGDGTIEAKGP